MSVMALLPVSLGPVLMTCPCTWDVPRVSGTGHAPSLSSEISTELWSFLQTHSRVPQQGQEVSDAWLKRGFPSHFYDWGRVEVLDQ
jgi:hypothetical protein